MCHISTFVHLAKECPKLEECLRYVATKPLRAHRSIYNDLQMKGLDKCYNDTRDKFQSKNKQIGTIVASHDNNSIGPHPILQRVTVSEYQQASSACPLGCICKCHAPRRFKVSLYDHLLGSFSITVSAASRSKSLCTETSCSQRLMSIARVTYRLPSWFLGRILYLSVIMQPQVGLNTSLETLRIVPDDADIMRLAKIGDLEGVRPLIEQRLASPLMQMPLGMYLSSV